MITEDYISFEIAKLLKEKGFDGDTASCYILEDSTHHIMGDKVVQSEYYESQDSNEHGHLIQAPTLQMAMKWLRDAHKLIPIILTGGDSQNPFYYWFRIDTIKEGKLEDAIYREDEKIFPTYEQACEEAIKYCLKNLI